jgi:preprotein translocase subunit SecB
MSEDVKNNENTEQAQGPEFSIQRVYIKDLSLEVADSPQVFLEKWEPELNLDVHTSTSALEESLHEVVLTLTVTVKLKEKTAFLVEIKQAGIFSLKGFSEEESRPMLGAYCPNLLYPYARQAITNVVAQAGFPQLYLSHINFDALFQQHEQEAASGAEAESSTEAS